MYFTIVNMEIEGSVGSEQSKGRLQSRFQELDIVAKGVAKRSSRAFFCPVSQSLKPGTVTLKIAGSLQSCFRLSTPSVKRRVQIDKVC